MVVLRSNAKGAKGGRRTLKTDAMLAKQITDWG